MNDQLPPPPAGFVETDDGRIVECSEEQLSAMEKDEKIVNYTNEEVTHKPGDILKALTAQEKNKQIVETYKALFLKRYGLEGIDLEKEFEKIQKKESSLSRSKRDAVVAAMQIFPIMQKQMEQQNEIEDLPVGTPLTKEEADAAIAEANKEADKSAE